MAMMTISASFPPMGWTPLMKTKCGRPSVEAATNTIKDLLKFTIVRNSHFKHPYLFIY